LNDRGCVLFHENLKALRKRREKITLHAEGVQEKYEENEVLYPCSLTECTCTFYCNNQAPCRHILRKREDEFGSLSAVFKMSLFHRRYRKDNEGNEECRPEASVGSECNDELRVTAEADADDEDVKMKTLTTREKYNMMLPVALSIASLATHHGTSTFLTYLAAMKEFERCIRAGATLPLAASGCTSTDIESKSIQLAAPTAREDSKSSDDVVLPPPENGSHGLSEEGRFLFSFRQKIRARGRPKRATKQLSFNKTTANETQKCLY